MDFPERKIGQQFQEETKYLRASYHLRAQDKSSLSTSPEFVSLPQPTMEGGLNIWKTMQNRRSIRDYSKDPLSLRELASLLWATQGITKKALAPWYRTAPSAGALHPIDTYLIVNRVKELESGVYLLHPMAFGLEKKRNGDYSSRIAAAALDQEVARAAAVVFVWVAVIHRSRQKYQQRAYRYIYLDCGHIGQNLYLAATSMGLGCCGIAAFYDDEVNDLVGVDGQEETAIYLATVGKKEGLA